MIWAICVWWFRARADAAARSVWKTDLNDSLVEGVVAFLVPAIPAIVAWRSPSMHGWWFSTVAGAFGATTLLMIPVALFSSSMMDRLVIVPRIVGLTKPDPIWRSVGKDDPSRRRTAQGWVAQRGICELVVFTAIAVILAVALVALINAVSHDNTLPAALESLGGAGIAVYIFGVSGPRHAQAIGFCLSGPVGLGSWVKGPGEFGTAVEGLVIDVSVEPGMKIIQVNDDRTIVPLKVARHLTADDRPGTVSSEWCRERVLEHVLKLDAAGRAAWGGPRA